MGRLSSVGAVIEVSYSNLTIETVDLRPNFWLSKVEGAGPSYPLTTRTIALFAFRV
jgi:hypothetical protein